MPQLPKPLKMNYTMRFMAVLLLAFASCGGPQPQENISETSAKTLSIAEQAFMDNLRSLCGKSFAGAETYMAAGRESWAHYDFTMHVTVCDEMQVHIPFHLSDDRSRTWMFLNEDGRLRFRHDHRHEDGTPEDQTLYGGYADGSGTAFMQHFPADEYTIELLQDTLGRQWTIILADDLSTMKYRLSYMDELIFEGTFDLREEI